MLRRSLVSALGVFSLAHIGCIAHGDAVAFYRIRGTIVDASSGAPLAGARVWVTTWAQCAGDRTKMFSASTACDGAFSVNAGAMIGSVTWLLIVPLFQGDWRLPPVDNVYIEAESNGHTGRAEVHAPPCSQKELPGHDREVELGTAPLTLRATNEVQAAPDEPAR